MHLEFARGEWDDTHRQIFRVCLDVRHVHVFTEKDGVFFHSFVLFVLRLDLAKIVAHLAHNSEFNLAIICTCTA